MNTAPVFVSYLKKLVTSTGVSTDVFRDKNEVENVRRSSSFHAPLSFKLKKKRIGGSSLLDIILPSIVTTRVTQVNLK